MLASTTRAEDNHVQTDAVGQSLPAVDGLNAKATLFGGAVGGNALYGAVGSVSMPLGSRFGLQIDGVATDFDGRFEPDIAGGGVAAHLFWRDPSVGLLGAYGHYLHTDAFAGVDVIAGAAEGALYLRRFTIEGIAGVQGGEIDLAAQGTFDIATRFFGAAHLSYYPTDNLKLYVGHSYMLGTNAAKIGAELGLPVAGGSGTMPALFAIGSINESGNGAVMGGLRFYFGQHNKSLIRRHREDDPAFVALPIEIRAARVGGPGQRVILDSATAWNSLAGSLY